MEFFAPSTRKPERVHFTLVYLTRYVPPTEFLTLSAAYSSLERPALFHAGNVHGVLLSRGFPSQPSPVARHHRNTLSTFLRASAAVNHCACLASGPTYLSACKPNHRSPSGLCSGCESVPREDFYIRIPSGRSPPELFLPLQGIAHAYRPRHA
jgi:hypothetical protein